MSLISPRRILVPVNGNATVDEIVSLACLLARQTRGEIHFIYIIEVPLALALDADLPRETERGETVLDRAESLARRLAERSANVAIHVDLLQARYAGPAIVGEAIQRGADLILLGIVDAKRSGEYEDEFDIGLTAQHVLLEAPCRVWVCRQPVG
jgi:nucleotide-binding universal stress UspA family protein